MNLYLLNDNIFSFFYFLFFLFKFMQSIIVTTLLRGLSSYIFITSLTLIHMPHHRWTVVRHIYTTARVNMPYAFEVGLVLCRHSK